MADSKETSQEYSSVNGKETAASTLNNTQNGLYNGVGKKLVQEKEVVPHYGNAVVTQEKNKILQTTTELQEIIINILQQKLKLSHIRNQHFMNALSNAVEFLDGVKIAQVKDFTLNTEKFLDECHSTFMNYEEMYKKSKILLSNFLINIEKVLRTNELPKNCELQERVLFSIFEEKLVSYNGILTSSEKAFSEFESLLNYLKTPEQDIDMTINLLLNTFNKAEIAFDKLKTLAVAVLKTDFAQV